jgi:hypothetical protein
LRIEKIDEHPEAVRVELDCERVDREIASVEVQLDGAHLDDRQRRGEL